MHRREEPLAPDRHPGHLAIGDDHHPAKIIGDLLRIDAAQSSISASKPQPVHDIGCSINPKCRVTRVMPAPTGTSVTRSAGSMRVS